MSRNKNTWADAAQRWLKETSKRTWVRREGVSFRFMLLCERKIVKNLLGLLLLLFSSMALSQTTVYHCTMDGRKVVTTYPCIDDSDTKEVRQAKILEMEEQERKYQCNNLEKTRTSIIGQQQQGNTQDLKESLRIINQTIYRLRCNRL